MPSKASEIETTVSCGSEHDALIAEVLRRGKLAVESQRIMTGRKVALKNANMLVESGIPVRATGLSER